MNTSIALVLLAVIAPGVTTSTATSVCDLITRQEAAAALGAAVPAGAEKNLDAPILGRPTKIRSCFFGSEVSVSRFELGKTAATLFEQYRQSLKSKSDYENVKGVGDDAFLAKGQLAVRKGEVGLIVDVGQARGGGAKELQKEKGLALLAIGRL